MSAIYLDMLASQVEYQLLRDGQYQQAIDFKRQFLQSKC